MKREEKTKPFVNKKGQKNVKNVAEMKEKEKKERRIWNRHGRLEDSRQEVKTRSLPKKLQKMKGITYSEKKRRLPMEIEVERARPSGRPSGRTPSLRNWRRNSEGYRRLKASTSTSSAASACCSDIAIKPAHTQNFEETEEDEEEEEEVF